MWAPWQRAHRGNASTKTPSGLETANPGNQKLINFTQGTGETNMKTLTNGTLCRNVPKNLHDLD